MAAPRVAILKPRTRNFRVEHLEVQVLNTVHKLVYRALLGPEEYLLESVHWLTIWKQLLL